MKLKKIDDKPKTIDISVLNNYKKELEKSISNKTIQPHVDESTENVNPSQMEHFYKSYDGYILDEYDSDKNKVKEIKIPFNSAIIEVKEKLDDYFDYYETYFQNGNIRSKKVFSKLGFETGKKFNYNEKGKLIDVIDTDQGYDFTVEDVFQFCKKNKISFESKSFPLSIMKITRQDGKKTWVIEYPNAETQKIEVYVLDGASGKVITKELRNWPVFKHLSPNNNK